MIIFMAGTMLFAQQLSMVEKTYELTGKTKRGTLVDVKYENATQQYKLYYSIKSMDLSITLQIYTFDKDFNFIDMKSEDYPVDKLAELKKLNPFDFGWVNYRGPSFSYEGVTVEGNLLGNLVLKRKRTTYTYNWFLLEYTRKVEILEKVKPKNDEGSRFFYFTHFEDDASGDLYVLAGARESLKKGGDPYKYHREIHVMKFNKDLDLIKDITLPLKYYNGFAYAKVLTAYDPAHPEAESFDEMILVFAPYQLGKEYNDPDRNNYTYFRLDKELNIKENIPVASKASYWNIDYILATEDAVYVFGPLATGKDAYYNMLKGNVKKYQSLQLMKIAGGKIDYLTETNLEEIAAKLKTPPSQKKTPEYSGKKFEIMNYNVFPNGDFVVSGQNFRVDEKEGNKYLDIIGFHFDQKGVLKSQYGVDTKETNEHAKKYGAPQNMLSGTNPANAYWLVQEIRGYSDWYQKILTYPRVAKVNLAEGTLGDFSDLGNKDYFLDPKFPYLESEPGNFVFFGSNKSGKTLWFAKVILE